MLDAREDALHRKIDALTKIEKEDIAEQSIYFAERKIKNRNNLEDNSKPMEFTGYWRSGTNQVYGMQYVGDDNDTILLRVKGGAHPVIDIPLNFGERKRCLIAMAKILGFNARKHKRGYHEIFIPKTNKNKRMPGLTPGRTANSKPT